MKVILLQDVFNVGIKNDVKDVSDGFARNFLFARNLAKPATKQSVITLIKQKTAEEIQKSEEHKKYKAIVEKLKSLALTFKIKIGERGRAFGSVTAVKIRDALKKQGIEVKKEWVLLQEPVRTIGEKKVKIKLPHALAGEVAIVIEAEGKHLKLDN